MVELRQFPDLGQWEGPLWLSSRWQFPDQISELKRHRWSLDRSRQLEFRRQLKRELGREASKTVAGSLSLDGGSGDPEKSDSAMLLECWVELVGRTPLRPQRARFCQHSSELLLGTGRTF